MGKFWDWFCKPAEDLIDYVKDKEEYPLHNVEEGEKVNIVCPSFSKGKSLFRPQNFSQYIGQARAKDRLRRIIKGTTSRKITFPHTLVSGNAGSGKTTLIKLLSKELKLKCVECIASDIETFDDIIERIEETDGGFLFIDEVHGLDRSMCEKLYTIMEDFLWQGEKIIEFSLVSCTTELGEIIANRLPFYDRFENVIELEEYEKKDLIKILSQYNSNMFPDDMLPSYTYNIIADNCRGVPRRLISLLKHTIYFDGEVHEVLKSFNILKDGYTTTDLKILEYLAENEKGVGLNGLVAFLNTSQANYQFQWEPFLLQKGMLTRTARGRKITGKGIELIKELNKIKELERR